MKYFFCCLLLLFYLSANSQELTERFSDIENWDFFTNGISLGDNMQNIKIKRNLRSAGDRGPAFIAGTINRDTLRFGLQYTVPLPRDSIFLSFDFKSCKLETLSLKLYFYDKKEQFIDS
ncbi:MAG: hypothetical protein LBQ60_11385, partial [Bacteroidales bacterium]|nr:hypothetical protein [Bacteroidales bacterium]